jgi:Na+/melibiose symporter-like transporter
MGYVSVIMASVVLLPVSYTSIYAAVVIAPFWAFASTTLNVAMSNLLAAVIDYDCLLTGKRRESTYEAILVWPMVLILAVGSGVPLSLITLLGGSANVDDVCEAY